MSQEEMMKINESYLKSKINNSIYIQPIKKLN